MKYTWESEGVDGESPGEDGLPAYAQGFLLPFLWDVLPDSASVLLVSAVCGAGFCLVIYATGRDPPISSWVEIGKSTSFSLNFVLLPIMIFQAGWALHLPDFYAQLLIGGVGSTAISVSVFFLILKLMSGPIGMEWDRGELAAFCSLISAVDAAAPLATFQSLGVEPFLKIITLGEALTIDAVAMVFFEGLNGKEDSQAAGSWWVLQGSSAWYVLWQLVGSGGLSLILARIMVAGFSVIDLQRDKQNAALYVVLCPFMLWVSAVATNLSGVISVLFGGAYMGRYFKQVLSDRDVKEHIESLLELLAHLGEFTVFTMVGIGAAMGSVLGACGLWGNRRNYVFLMQLSVVIFIACLVGRALAVCFFAWVYNAIHRCRRRQWTQEEVNEYLITPRRAVVMWWGGGIRGAIALVCALNLRTRNMSLLVDVTMVNICLTMIIFGGTTKVLVKYLGIPLNFEDFEDFEDKIDMINAYTKPDKDELQKFYEECCVYLSEAQIKWVKCGFLRSLAASGAGMVRCQVIPPAEAIMGSDGFPRNRGDHKGRFVISHPWLTKAHPDPDGAKLQALVEQLDMLNASDEDAVFLDFMSLPQHDSQNDELQQLEKQKKWPKPGEHPAVRTVEEEAAFRKALGSMELMYSMASVPVIILPMDGHTAEGKGYISRGWCFLELCLAFSFGNIANVGYEPVRELCNAIKGMKADTEEGFKEAFKGTHFTESGDDALVLKLFNNTIRKKSKTFESMRRMMSLAPRGQQQVLSAPEQQAERRGIELAPVEERRRPLTEDSRARAMVS